MQNPASTRNATDVSRVGQVLITDGNLEVVDEGVEYIVHAEKSVLDGSALDLHLRFASRSDRTTGWTSGARTSMGRCVNKLLSMLCPI